MNKTYKFLGYVASDNGIKFGRDENVIETVRFDRRLSLAPGSTKVNPISFIRGEIAFSSQASVKNCADDKCGLKVPVTASVKWSGPYSESVAIIDAIDTVIAALTAKRAVMLGGYLPNTDDIVLSVGV